MLSHSFFSFQIFNISKKNLWIGLSFTDNKDASTFTWSDNTPFTYGNDLENDINCGNNGPGPWYHNYPIEFNNGIAPGELCVPLAKEGCWDINACSSGSNYALCNLPSEFYPPLNKWTKSSGDWILNGTSKTVKQVSNALTPAGLVLYDKQWYNGAQNFYIDFMYSIDFKDQTNVEMSFTIYNGARGIGCEYYQIGMRRKNETAYGIRILRNKQVNGSSSLQSLTELYWIVSPDQEIGRFFLMSIEIRGGVTFAVNIDDRVIIEEFRDPEPYTVRGDGLSGYIGFWSSAGIVTTLRDLYVSGTPRSTIPLQDDCDSLAPSPAPTDSTLSPTDATAAPSQESPSPTDATLAPSLSPLPSPSNSPTDSQLILTPGPSQSPADSPTPASTNGTIESSMAPTNMPSAIRPMTSEPSNAPTVDPTEYPTIEPSEITINPTEYPTVEPSLPSVAPSENPSKPSSSPSISPIAQIRVPTQSPFDLFGTKEDDSSAQMDKIVYVIIILVSVCIVCVIIFIMFMVYKKKKSKEKDGTDTAGKTDESKKGKHDKEAVHSVELSGPSPMKVVVSSSEEPITSTAGLDIDKGDEDEIDILKQESRAAEALYSPVNSTDAMTPSGEDEESKKRRLDKMESRAAEAMYNNDDVHTDNLMVVTPDGGDKIARFMSGEKYDDEDDDAEKRRIEKMESRAAEELYGNENNVETAGMDLISEENEMDDMIKKQETEDLYGVPRVTSEGNDINATTARHFVE